MKKNGKIGLLFFGFLTVGFVLGEISKQKFTNNNSKDIIDITLGQYMNRLTEFDLTDEKEATSLFLDLIENGFYPESAFNVVQKECLEVGEVF
jgi:hypothetical protein